MGDFRGPRRDSFGPKKMYDAVCSKCGNKCQVPFKPSNDAEGKPRPVYCRECYAQMRRD